MILRLGPFTRTALHRIRSSSARPISRWRKTFKDDVIDNAIALQASLLPLGLHPTSDRPSVWLAFTVVTGLPLALWAYKCLMLVVFQRKVIYMGYAPPGARSEELRDVPPGQMRGIHCSEVCVTSGKSTLHGIITRCSNSEEPPDTVILYLQGNAGSPLHRIPVFQTLLTPSVGSPKFHPEKLVIVAVAPRSYWKSSLKSPTENGILADYTSVLDYTLQTFPSANVLLYGHSLGGAVAVCLLSRLRDRTIDSGPPREGMVYDKRYKRITGLVLENPFASIPAMVRALYPNRWLPYHYLGPLAFDKWDATAAMKPKCCHTSSVLERVKDDMMVLISEKDEVVPVGMGEEIFGTAMQSQGRYNRMLRKIVIDRALHENAWTYRQWSREMKTYISDRSTTVS